MNTTRAIPRELEVKVRRELEAGVNYLRFLFDLLSDMAEAIERAEGTCR